MRGRWLGFLGLFPLVVALAANSNAGDVVKDLAAVRGMEWYRGPEAGKALLAKNGFVVTTRFYHRIFGPYLDKNLPHFVTADSVHRTYHVLFEEHLKEMERVFAVDAAALAAAMREALERQPPNAVAEGALAGSGAESRQLAVQYFQVAGALFSGDAPGDGIPEAVRAEWELIQRSAGVAESPLFGRDMDYTLFRPRGFYTESPELRRYFRALTWYGGGAFLLQEPRDTLAALMVARALLDTPKALARWERLDRVYTAFLGPCDDLTPLEYGERLPKLGVLASEEALAAAMETLRKELRDPAINGMALSSGQMMDWAAETKGMRFLGKRYVPDSAVFMDLTDPAVPGRGFPTGLDLMAANGSTRAAALMAETPWGNDPAYGAGAEKAAARMATVKSGDTTQYAALLRVAETLYAPPEPNAAGFAKTAAYADKNLMTSLGAWASTRHAWMLHAKRSNMTRSARFDEPPPGYVEPNPAFFVAMKELTGRTKALFSEAGLADLERFASFESLLEQLAEIVTKELAGESLDEGDLYVIREYGFRIAALQGIHTDGKYDGNYPWMALVADVHTEHASGQCLEVATGGAMPIYVVVEHAGAPYLHVGGVYSYYEFPQPLSNRLTDEAWRRTWDKGAVPALPAWTGSFVAGAYDIPALIARLRKGEIVEGLEFIRDPALDEFLVERVLQAPDALYRHSGYLFREASRRAPDVVNPLLLEMLATGAIPEGKWDGNPPSALGAMAAAGLTGNIREEDVPALVEIIAQADALKVRHVAYALSGVDSAIAGKVLIEGLKQCSDEGVKFQLLNLLRFEVSISLVPALLEVVDSEMGVMRMKCLLTAGFLWRYFERQSSVGMKADSDFSENDLQVWRRRTEVAINEELAGFDWEKYDQGRGALRAQMKAMDEEHMRFYEAQGTNSDNLGAAIRVVRFRSNVVSEAANVAGQLALQGAVPFLREALIHSDRDTSRAVLNALVEIGSDEAIDEIARVIMQSSTADAIQGWLGEARRNGNDSDFQTYGQALKRLLMNTEDIPGASLRVCDMVIGILAAENFENSPGLPASNASADRDANALAWVGYIEAMQSVDVAEARGRLRDGER